NNKNYYYLLMTKLDGFMACDEELMKNPEKLIDSLVSGIKSFWKIPIVDCPIDNRIENKLKLAKQRIEDNTVDIDDWDQELTKKRFETPNDLYQYLLANQIEEELVMSHGDY
ncbi:MAG: hypothetical protein Q7I99_03665, partial [Acholeplasmataceae bacterium]|nr:hypothetical protein [Acholeplasmataceae bacterium]